MCACMVDEDTMKHRYLDEYSPWTNLPHPRDCDCDFYCVGLWLRAPRCCWSRTRRHDRLRTVIILITYSWPWRYDTTESRGRE